MSLAARVPSGRWKPAPPPSPEMALEVSGLDDMRNSEFSFLMKHTDCEGGVSSGPREQTLRSQADCPAETGAATALLREWFSDSQARFQFAG